MYCYPGTWRNFDYLEDCLSLKELALLLDSAREQQQLERKFAAAIQGIDIDKDSGQSEFEKVKERAIAKARGVTEDEVALDGLIDFVDEDELDS